jgi:hypothetical protein
MTTELARALDDSAVEHFIHRGYVVLEGAIPRALADEWASAALARVGYSQRDPSARVRGRIHLPSLHMRVDVTARLPRVWAAQCELLGGAERAGPCFVWDSFIVTIDDAGGASWEPPSPRSPGWHVDGDHFRHFLDSPEQGLVSLFACTDILPRGGGTLLACDSVAVIAHLLAAHPQGVLPEDFDFHALVRKCRDFIQLTARAGDVILVHPFVLHAASPNHLAVPRVIANAPLPLREPMNFAREDPRALSPVERAVLRGLGLPRLEFFPTAGRERVASPRAAVAQRMRDEEETRIAAGGCLGSGGGNA